MLELRSLTNEPTDQQTNRPTDQLANLTYYCRRPPMFLQNYAHCKSLYGTCFLANPVNYKMQYPEKKVLEFNCKLLYRSM